MVFSMNEPGPFGDIKFVKPYWTRTEAEEESGIERIFRFGQNYWVPQFSVHRTNEFNDDSFVVIVFPDHGSRYLSKIYSDEWMNNQGFYDSIFNQPNLNTINYI